MDYGGLASKKQVEEGIKACMDWLEKIRIMNEAKARV
jgi:hypothetical protein